MKSFMTMAFLATFLIFTNNSFSTQMEIDIEMSIPLEENYCEKIKIDPESYAASHSGAQITSYSEEYLCNCMEWDAKLYIPVGGKFIKCKKVPNTNQTVEVHYISADKKCMRYTTQPITNAFSGQKFSTNCWQ